MQVVYQDERAILSGSVEVVKLRAMIHSLEQRYDLQAAQIEREREKDHHSQHQQRDFQGRSRSGSFDFSRLTVY